MGYVVNRSTLIAQIHGLLDAQAAADRFSGTVLVAHDQQPLLMTARGYAIHPNVLPNRPDTKFNIASVTKMLTAVAIIAVFNFYISIARGEPFRRRFVEMAGLSLSVAAFSFGIGYLIRLLLGVEV